MTEFDRIRKEGRLAYEYIRGSQLYGLNTPTSDTDTGGVYLCTRDELYGLYGYKPQVSDERHDNTWFEIGELLRLLMKSNFSAISDRIDPNFVKLPEDRDPRAPVLDLMLEEVINPYFVLSDKGMGVFL